MSQRGRRTHSKRGKGKKNNKRNKQMVWTRGQNQPQNYPFAPDKRPVKRGLSFFTTLTSDATGNVLARFNLRNLTRAWNGAGTYSDAANLSNVYDVYKPMFVTLNIVPAFATGNFGARSLVVCADYEDNDLTQVVGTVADAAAYAERQIIDPRRPSIITIKVPTLSAGSIPGLTSTSPAVIQSGGYLDFNAPPYDGVGYIVGGGFPANLVIADVHLIMDVLLKFGR